MVSQYSSRQPSFKNSSSYKTPTTQNYKSSSKNHQSRTNLVTPSETAYTSLLDTLKNPSVVKTDKHQIKADILLD